jgi:Protein of unknown function (DUF1552)
MPMSNQPLLSRRTVLRGSLSMSLALPWLDAMGPLNSHAADSLAPKGPPNRMAFLYAPNGQTTADWAPKAEGPNFPLTYILEPLKEVKDAILILSGLSINPGFNGDGGHARAMGGYLTGAMVNKSEGGVSSGNIPANGLASSGMRAGISVDQVAAARLGDRTRVPSLQIGCEQGALAGNCDGGFSCAYTSSMSWKSATQPLPKEVDPAMVFERLFGAVPAGQQARLKSILDFVNEDSKDLQTKLGKRDQRKLDQYFTTIREVELQIARAEKMPAAKQLRITAKPVGIPADYREHLRLMCDLLVLAFQADVTRICTFMFANELSNRSYPFLGISAGHHDLTHASDWQTIRRINHFHTSQLAYFLEKLKSIPEGDGSLLDHCMVVYGSGMEDGSKHNYDNLPVLLAGKGCGTLKPGRHIRYPNKKTPLSNLWVSLLNRMGLKAPKLGDSTGPLPGLSG